MTWVLKHAALKKRFVEMCCEGQWFCRREEKRSEILMCFLPHLSFTYFPNTESKRKIKIHNKLLNREPQ